LEDDGEGLDRNMPGFITEEVDAGEVLAGMQLEDAFNDVADGAGPSNQIFWGEFVAIFNLNALFFFICPEFSWRDGNCLGRRAFHFFLSPATLIPFALLLTDHIHNSSNETSTEDSCLSLGSAFALPSGNGYTLSPDTSVASQLRRAKTAHTRENHSFFLLLCTIIHTISSQGGAPGALLHSQSILLLFESLLSVKTLRFLSAAYLLWP
jgi:hypothetical protein